MKAIKEFLLGGGGIIAIFVLLGLIFWGVRVGSDLMTNNIGKITKLNNELSESDKTMYDGIEVSGSEVLNVINRLKNEEIGIIVTTKKSTTYYTYNLSINNSVYTLSTKSSASIKDAKKITNTTYINPNAQFTSSVLRDANDAIVGLQFVQN